MPDTGFQQAFGPGFVDSLNTMGGMIPLSFDPAASTPIGVGTPDLSGIGSIGAIGGGGGGSPYAQKLGFNMGTANLALSGLSTIAGLWGAFKQASLAKKQFEFSKNFQTANLNNQVSAFNEMLDGRARSRAAVEGQSAQQQQAYYDRFKAQGMPGK